jgi:excisionase family DNA binding protein
MSLPVVSQSETSGRNQATLIERIDAMESALLTFLTEVRSIKGQISKQAVASPSLESLLDAEEVAKLLGVDIAYIYKLARSNKIPSIQIGKYRKFSPSQIKKWLDRKNTP